MQVSLSTAFQNSVRFGKADAAEKWQRQSEQAAVAHEVAAADAAIDKSVYEMVLERRAAAPQEIENAVVCCHFLVLP
ncbi:hypothetical protein [Mesorhizobium sp.]|uniref:hypothetical protein n=1 Tax=Mesorhizobium sp. TaxID=1871066 RepID=UPI0025D6F317|nr:hypothetical protein [Mesorhizobium sp.]